MPLLVQYYAKSFTSLATTILIIIIIIIGTIVYPVTHNLFFFGRRIDTVIAMHRKVRQPHVVSAAKGVPLPASGITCPVTGSHIHSSLFVEMTFYCTSDICNWNHI